MKKRLPKWKTDKEAEEFLDQDLSSYLEAENFVPMTFEFESKTKSVTVRVSDRLLKAVKAAAKKRKMAYQKLIRQAIEHYLA